MNPSTALATVLVDEMVRCGVHDVVLAPGSRSAPLALAFAKAHDEKSLELHIRIDERSAGFLALGIAKVSRRPVAVLTTSGTAVANLFPAVVEASQSGVPLLVLTADRPPELRGVGANQTIDQVGIFGRYVRSFTEVGVAEERASQNAYWRSVVSRSVSAAEGRREGQSGPVHLNLPLREPLVPEGPTAWVESLDGREGGAPWSIIEPPTLERPTAELPARTLIVVGDCLPEEGRDAALIAEEHGWPVISEPSGNALRGPNAISTGGWLLAIPQLWERLRPDQILVVGRPTLSRAVLTALLDEAVEVSVVSAATMWPDPTRRASRVFSSLPAADGRHTPDGEWLEAWRSAETAARERLDAQLDEATASEQHATRALHAALPSDALLVAGSSLPIRHLFLCAKPRDGVTVVANRGAAGIDGTTSTAVGAAAAWQRSGGGQAVALVGDLTFLHDSNGLAVPDGERPRLTIVVLSNDGGGIFELLESSDVATVDRLTFERVFGTPHGADLAALCGAHHVPFTRVGTTDELLTAAMDPRADMQVIELRADRVATAATHRNLQQSLQDIGMP